MNFENNLAFAQALDKQDILAKYKSQFSFPQHNGKNVIYFTGNSLGLQSIKAKEYVNEVMADWANMAVEGHFYSKKPWWDYHERFCEPLSKLVGAKPSEVGVMNTLTVNLHLLFVSFYQPTKTRYKILCEEKAFPSDQYMLQSQVSFFAKLLGFDPKEAIVEVKRNEKTLTTSNEDIIAKINEIGDELALVFIGGLNYYTGQVFDMENITKAGHKVGAKVGWDLAHAAGNIELKLHDWQVDFAAWCSYKYMNSGPGNASGYFINQKYHQDKSLSRFAGWYGHNKERRFLMEPQFDAVTDANGWQISNQPVLALAPYLASVEMFHEAGFNNLIAKRNTITAYLEFILNEVEKESNGKVDFEVITPKERGSQLSIYVYGKGKELFTYLMQNGVIVDWREPNVIRLAPVPFYTSYEDIYNFGQVLLQAII
jgi:kynureninase